MKKNIYIITDVLRADFVIRLLNSLHTKTHRLSNLHIYVIENGENPTFGSLENRLNKYNGFFNNFEVITFENRSGLSTMWDWCVSSCRSGYAFVLNDDCVATERWDEKFETIEKMTPHQMYLLCHPNGFSGFALNKNLYEENCGFNTDFPEGYYEDDDFFLRTALIHETDYDGVFKNYIFSYYDNFGESLFVHEPHSIVPTRKWDKFANKRIFDKEWEEVPLGTENAIMNKNGKWYKYIGNNF